MKSRLIPAIPDDRDQGAAFKRHLGELLSLNRESLAAVLQALPAYRLARTTRLSNKLVTELADSTPTDRATILHSLHVLQFFLDALLNDEIPPEDSQYWGEDLVLLKWLPPGLLSHFNSLAAKLQTEIFPDIEVKIQERRAASRVVPTLRSFGVTVDLRAIRKDFYRWGSPLKEYLPEVMGLTPVFSVHIGVDAGLV